MIRNILKKDLKRKKTMNIIILLFVILATVFVASSVNNIITVMNGTQYYFEQAGVGDYNVITMGEDVVGNLDDMLMHNSNVKDYKKEEVVFASQDQFSIDGKKMKMKNSVLLQSLSDAGLRFFNENNEQVDFIEEGKIYMTANSMEENNLTVGDQIRIKHSNVDMTFEVAGRLKDALLGSTFMGNSRILMNAEDYKRFAEDDILKKQYRGEVCYITTDDTDAINEALGEVDGVAFAGAKSLIRMAYVMDMVIAGLLLVVSCCLIIVSFIVLKFTITFTLTEEFREIGVMKAIGLGEFKIRSIYLTKYLAISVLGAAIGLAGSVPFGTMLMKSVSKNMVLGNSGGLLSNIISAIVVVAVIILYAFRCTGKVKKYSPIDAIRSGQTGERFKKKTNFRLLKSPFGPTSYMAYNDVLSSPKRYLTIILAFTICSILVFMIVNTTETMTSDKLLYSFGTESDVFIGDVDRAMKGMTGSGKDAVYEILDQYEEQMADKNMPAKVSVEAQYKYKVKFDDQVYKLTFQQGIRTKTTDYRYYEGQAPMSVHEIAITKQVADMTGARIGDSLQVTVGDKTEDYLITGYFDTMNNLGELIRLHEDVDTNLGESSSVLTFQVDFLDAPSKDEIQRRVEVLKDMYDNEDIFDGVDYVAHNIGVVDTMKAVQYLLLAITMIVVVLVTILMERSFISDEKGEIAILKAVGFSDGSIIRWHVQRFLLVGIFSVLLAVILSVPVTQLCITPVFRMMGMRQVEYELNFLKLCLIYPVIILAGMAISVALCSLYSKKITCADTASIE